MGIFTNKNDSKPLPPMPGAAIQPNANLAIKGVPFVIYIHGNPVELSKKEALSVMGQILNIQLYLEEAENDSVPFHHGRE